MDLKHRSAHSDFVLMWIPKNVATSGTLTSSLAYPIGHPFSDTKDSGTSKKIYHPENCLMSKSVPVLDVKLRSLTSSKTR